MANSELGLAMGSFQAELKRLTDSSMIHILAAAEADIAAQRTDTRHLQELRPDFATRLTQLEQRETDIGQRERAILRKETAVADCEVALARGVAAYMARTTSDSTAESKLLPGFQKIESAAKEEAGYLYQRSKSKSPLRITPSSPSVAKVCEKFGKVKAKADQSPSCVDSVSSPLKWRGLSHTREPTDPCTPTSSKPTSPCTPTSSNEPYLKAPAPCHFTTGAVVVLGSSAETDSTASGAETDTASSHVQEEESDQPVPGGASKLKQLFEQKVRASSATCNRVPPRGARISAPAAVGSGRTGIIPTPPSSGELSRSPREQRSSVPMIPRAPSSIHSGPMIPRAPSSIHSGASDALNQREQRSSAPPAATAHFPSPTRSSFLEKLLMADKARSMDRVSDIS